MADLDPSTLQARQINEKSPSYSPTSDPYIDSHDNEHLSATDGSTTTSKSPGVQRIEAISSSFTPVSKTILFAGIFLVACEHPTMLQLPLLKLTGRLDAYGLDGQTRYVYSATATSSFQTHSLLATVNVVRAIIAAASQPAYAKVADVFGRMELYVYPSPSLCPLTRVEVDDVLLDA